MKSHTQTELSLELCLKMRRGQTLICYQCLDQSVIWTVLLYVFNLIKIYTLCLRLAGANSQSPFSCLPCYVHIYILVDLQYFFPKVGVGNFFPVNSCVNVHKDIYSWSSSMRTWARLFDLQFIHTNTLSSACQIEGNYT